MTPTNRRMTWLGLGLAAAVGIGVAVAAVLAIGSLLRGEGPTAVAGTLDLPGRGEVRPDYMEDGTPVWVIGHADGTVSVLSGFDTHQPLGIGKVLWWCPIARAFENLEHGSKYDEYGLKIGGPAPAGLPSYEARVEGDQVIVGEPGSPPSVDVAHTGPPEVERDWCRAPGQGTFHRFDGWEAFDSPTAAVEAAPQGWILLNAMLAPGDDGVVLCALSGCADAVRATNVETPPPDLEFGPFFGERWIARVRDGALTDVTRVLPIAAP